MATHVKTCNARACPAPPRRVVSTLVRATQSNATATPPAVVKNALMSAAAAAVIAISAPALPAIAADKVSALGAQGCLAGVKCWDGSSVKGCPLGEEGEECRRKALSDVDVSSYNTDKKQAGASLQSKKGSIKNENSSEAYGGDLKGLGESITVYLTLDDFDPARVKATKDVQESCKTWAGKYAPGGKSARKSGTAMNVACNSLLGWTSFNGLAPLDSGTRSNIVSNIEKSITLLGDDL